MDLDAATEQHLIVRDLPSLLRPGDLLVLNETRVIAARIFGTRSGGGRVELLLLHPADARRYAPDAVRWMALARPAKRVRVGDRLSFGACGEAIVRALHPEGMREIEFALQLPFEAFLAAVGRLALPPYIHEDSDDSQRRYQTVFARVPGSVAAPTASLHFTKALLDRIAEGGVEIARLVLDVGLGTFRPMTAQRLADHTMHEETYAIDQATAEAIERTRARGGRIVAAGTTVVRALEGNAAVHDGRVVAEEGSTGIFIAPGFGFRVVDAMLTNFHLPYSSLLVLVSAFAGRERVLAAYARAVAEGYRFFSFGDAMFLTRHDAQP